MTRPESISATKHVSFSRTLSSSIPRRSALIGDWSQRSRAIDWRNWRIFEVNSRVFASRASRICRSRSAVAMLRMAATRSAAASFMSATMESSVG